jgi:DNA-binding transcriptional ArsR family regulator
MGITKSTVFNTQQNKLATIAKAIGHPARVAIIEYLLKNNSCICNDLVEVLPLSQSTISQHLKELKLVGIIKGEIEGPKMNYCIDEKVWEEAKDIMINLFSSYSPKQNCC